MSENNGRQRPRRRLKNLRIFRLARAGMVSAIFATQAMSVEARATIRTAGVGICCAIIMAWQKRRRREQSLEHLRIAAKLVSCMMLAADIAIAQRQLEESYGGLFITAYRELLHRLGSICEDPKVWQRIFAHPDPPSGEEL
jgi:hypothetical protein